MKNKILYVLAACLLASTLGGCSKDLDQAPAGKISLSDVFNDNDKTMYYLTTCYSSVPNKGLHYFFWSRGPVEWCDDAWDADDVDVPWAASSHIYHGTASASSHPVWDLLDHNNDNWGDELSCDYWPKYFARIRNCGIFLQNIEKAKVNNQTDRSRWTAEAHLLRAYYYSELLLWFGCGLPIIKEPYALDADYSKLTRGSYSDVVRFIIEDCDFAIDCPDLPWRITTPNEAIRVTKALAWAIKSRMSMFAASPLYNDSSDPNQITWDEAYKYSYDALDQLTANGYELYKKVNQTSIYSSSVEHAYMPNDYAALYNEYFCTSGAYSSSPADKETIYQLYDNNDGLANLDGIGPCCDGKTGTCPSQELVDSYETTNGETVLNLSKPYNDEQHLQPNYNTANKEYDPQNPYANRDPRFYASIYYNGSKRYCEWGFGESPNCFENYPADPGKRTRVIATWDSYQDGSGNIIEEREPMTGRDITSRTSTRTGYFERKFLHPNSGNNDDHSQGAHKDYRLAEIYLNLAETAMETGKHDKDALDNMNTVRSRVGMPPVENLSGDQLRQRIHNERRVELAMEGNRYFDVRRWHKPSDDLSATDKWVTAAHITHLADGSYKYSRTTIWERNCWQNKWLKVAIPLSEVNNIIAVTGDNWQNPGW